MRVKNKVVLITGGSGGLGGASARLLASEGAKVVLTDVAENAGISLAQEIGGSFYRHNVVSEEQWNHITNDILKVHGKIDVLLNAAGIEGKLSNGGGLNTTYEEWRDVMSINLDGTFLGCRVVAPHMIARGVGSIINISSIVSFMATSTALAYGASKAGVQQLTRSIAWIGAQNGAKVRCNSVHPGVIRTRMLENIMSELARGSNMSIEDSEKLICTAVPFGALGEPRDIAATILFLASDESSYVTGAEFKIDGGWLLKNAS